MRPRHTKLSMSSPKSDSVLALVLLSGEVNRSRSGMLSTEIREWRYEFISIINQQISLIKYLGEFNIHMSKSFVLLIIESETCI